MTVTFHLHVEDEQVIRKVQFDRTGIINILSDFSIRAHTLCKCQLFVIIFIKRIYMVINLKFTYTEAK